MNKPDISLTTLLERIESEAQIADGRTVRLCRDESGNYWVVDGAERVVSLREFAARVPHRGARVLRPGTRGGAPPDRYQHEGSVRARREEAAAAGREGRARVKRARPKEKAASRRPFFEAADAQLTC